MRLQTNLVVFVLTISTVLALDNNNPETWRSPNKKYAIKEAFYGEGKRVVPYSSIFQQDDPQLLTARERAILRRYGVLTAIFSQSASSAVTIGRMPQSIGWSAEEFRRLSFLLGWSLLDSFRLPPRARFSTLAP